MLGEALKLSVLSDAVGVNSSLFYFPKGTWCDLRHPGIQCISSDAGQVLTLSTKAYDSYLHLREGYIVPMQNLTNYTATILSTADLQKQPIDLHILPLSDPQTGNWQASGFYLNDDGLNVNFAGEINSYQITATGTYIAL